MSNGVCSRSRHRSSWGLESSRSVHGDGRGMLRISWETEKTTLLKRVEEAEAALKPVAEDLVGLNHQINAMTAAMFGT